MRLAVAKKASLEASVLDISLKPLVRQRCYQRCVHHLPGATYPQFGHCSTVVSHVNLSRWRGSNRKLSHTLKTHTRGRVPRRRLVRPPCCPILPSAWSRRSTPNGQSVPTQPEPETSIIWSSGPTHFSS